MSEDLAASNEQRGSILFEQGRYAEAENYFREALRLEPNDAATLSRLALCALHLQRPAEAHETICRAIALAPEAAHLHALKAFIEVDLRKPAEALKSADEALTLDPECDDAFVAKASAYIHKLEWAKAEAAAREALEINPDHAGAANQLAHALRLQNRLHESDDQIAYMLAQDPEDADTHVAAGWTSLQRGNRQQAETHFLEALRLEPGNEAAREGLKESFRAKSPLYRAYLNYCFFMARFTEGKQWLLIIGLLVLVRVANAVLGPYGIIVAGLYMLFVLWVHVARPVGNLQLAFDRVARHALDRREAIEAWVCGGGVIAGLLLTVGGLVTGIKVPILLGFTLLGAAFPFAYTFTNVTMGRWIFGAIASLVLLAGAAAIADSLSGGQFRNVAAALSPLAFLGVIVTTWIASISAISRRA